MISQKELEAQRIGAKEIHQIRAEKRHKNLLSKTKTQQGLTAQATPLLAAVLNIKFVFLPKRICISVVSRSEGFVLQERYAVVGEK